MKTLILILLSIPCFSQTTIHFYYGTEQTTGAEVLFPVRNSNIYLGGGFSGAWNVKESVPGHISEYDLQQEVTDTRHEAWCSLYVTSSFGYLGPFLIKYRTGLAVYNDKVTFNNDYTKIEKVDYKPLFGVSAMYSLSDDWGVEIGADTFNEFTVGITVKF